MKIGDIVSHVLLDKEMQISEITIKGTGKMYLCTYIVDGDFKSQWFYKHELKEYEEKKVGFKKE